MSLGGVWRCSALKELDQLSRRQWAILRLVLLALTQYQIRALAKVGSPGFTTVTISSSGMLVSCGDTEPLRCTSVPPLSPAMLQSPRDHSPTPRDLS